MVFSKLLQRFVQLLVVFQLPVQLLIDVIIVGLVLVVILVAVQLVVLRVVPQLFPPVRGIPAAETARPVKTTWFTITMSSIRAP